VPPIDFAGESWIRSHRSFRFAPRSFDCPAASVAAHDQNECGQVAHQFFGKRPFQHGILLGVGGSFSWNLVGGRRIISIGFGYLPTDRAYVV
jgi:hypothetical protein